MMKKVPFLPQTRSSNVDWTYITTEKRKKGKKRGREQGREGGREWRARGKKGNRKREKREKERNPLEQSEKNIRCELNGDQGLSIFLTFS